MNHLNLIAMAQETDPQLAKELEEWSCPTCEGKACMVTQECSATMVVPVNDHGREALRLGYDPGAPSTAVRPVAYDLTFGCENGHEHYIRTESASRA